MEGRDDANARPRTGPRIVEDAIVSVVSPTRIEQIYNGVDTTRFVPAAARPAGVLPPGKMCLVIHGFVMPGGPERPIV